MVENQSTIFEMLYPTFKIEKPIRLITLFSGYDSQALALKYLGVDFELYKTCEWAIKSIQALKDLHFREDTKDYSKDLETSQIKEFLLNKGISSNYNEPMNESQINRLNEKQARTIYNNIKASHNLVNIQQVKGDDLEIVDTNKYTYIMTYSFPCQDLSLAGNRALMSDTSTRSGMLWEVERILSELEEKPQVLLMENVPQVHGEGTKEDFNKWQLRLEELGYKNYWKDLIATDYGIPQTRNRCFMVSILGDYNYTFPKPIPLKLRLKDMLEDNVNEKYFLSDRCIKTMVKHDVDYKPTGLAPTITTELSHHTGKNFTPKIIREIDFAVNNKSTIDEKYYLSEAMKEYILSKDDKYKVNENKLVINRDIACSKTTREGWSRADTSDYISNDVGNNYVGTYDYATSDLFNPTKESRIHLNKKVSGTLLASGNQNGILVKNATKQGYLEATEGDGIDISSRMEYHRGNVQKEKIQTLTTQCDRGVVVNMKTELCNSLIKNGKVKENDVIRHSYTTSRMNGDMKDLKQNNLSPTLDTRCDCLGVVNNMRIRKLTPRECFRLMGVKDEDYDKVAKNQSDSSLYHLAGDSIVVNVLMAIFKEMI